MDMVVDIKEDFSHVKGWERITVLFLTIVNLKEQVQKFVLNFKVETNAAWHAF